MNFLYDALRDNRDSGICPMHMPGHKRNTQWFQMDNPYGLDITEIDGFDNLHDAQGILKDAMERAAFLWGSKQSWFLVNGSSCGVLAGVAACTQWGDEILVARNSHKSLYNALYQNNLNPYYLYPEKIPGFEAAGGVSPQAVEEALQTHPGVKLVVITSPTYEGVLSDIASIASIAHARGIPLLVDEAHGAHLGLAPGFPPSAVQCGADLVVQSLHKTLPSFTQTAILHRNGNLVDPLSIERQLSIYETSSPSYLLMASMDQCIRFLLQHGREAFADYRKRLDSLRDALSNLSSFRLLGEGHEKEGRPGRHGIYALDPSKIVLGCFQTGFSGPQIMASMRHIDRIELEMAASCYVIAMTSLCDTEEAFQRLLQAMLRLEREQKMSGRTTSLQEQAQERNPKIPLSVPVKVMTLRDAEERKGEIVPLSKAKGRICRETLFAYPPGIPLIVPGERIEESFLERLHWMQSSGVSLSNSRHTTIESIDVVKDNGG